MMAGTCGRVRGERFYDAKGRAALKNRLQQPLWLDWMENPKCVGCLMRSFVDGGG